MLRLPRLERLERSKFEKLGNTKQVSQALKWCFTWNNYNDDVVCELKELFAIKSRAFRAWIIGFETGESGTKHIQGYLRSDKRFRPSELPFKKCKWSDAHWEVAKGSDEDNFKYCSKDGLFETNMKKLLLEHEPLEILKDNDLYQWQKKVIDIVTKKPDNRTIYWIWEPNGNTGKTSLCKYLCHKYNAVIIEGRKNDCLFCASQFNSKIYIVDFERSMEDFVPYSTIEKIKNGLYMSAKYESKPIIRNCPHVVCFANFEPDRTKLSEDRWKIMEIKKVSKDNIIDPFY